MKDIETYEVIDYGSKHQKGTILTENSISKEELDALLKSKLIRKLQGELMFDSSSSASFEVQD